MEELKVKMALPEYRQRRDRYWTTFCLENQSLNVDRETYNCIYDMTYQQAYNIGYDDGFNDVQMKKVLKGA